MHPVRTGAADYGTATQNRPRINSLPGMFPRPHERKPRTEPRTVTLSTDCVTEKQQRRVDLVPQQKPADLTIPLKSSLTHITARTERRRSKAVSDG